MKIYIKYMVSRRCKMMVMSELDKLEIPYGTVDLGEVEIKTEISCEQRILLNKGLLKSGLELMDCLQASLIEKIKTVIIDLVHYSDQLPKIKNSEFLSSKLHHDYTYLANRFSDATGITIEHFIIAHKVERIKELLLCDELTLADIADRMNYSSVAYLSAQFKKVTGLTPKYFKALMLYKNRIMLEDV